METTAEKNCMFCGTLIKQDPHIPDGIRLEYDRQHLGIHPCVSYLRVQRLLRLSLHSTAIFGTKGTLGGNKRSPHTPTANNGATVDGR